MYRDKKIILALLCFIALATTALFFTIRLTKVPTEKNNTVSEQTSKTPSVKKNDTSQNPSPSEIKEFSIVARQWSFSPSTITVKKGDRVVLRLTSADVTHGFALPAFRINEHIQPNTEQRIEFIADKTGTYPFFSSVYAGDGTKNMRGNITVVSPEGGND